MTLFVKGFFENVILLHPKQLVQVMLLRKHVGMSAKFSDLNLPPTLIRFLKGNSISLVITLATEHERLYKFCNSSHLRRKCPAYGKVCFVCNKKNHFKVCCPHVGKKVHEIEKDESDETSDQSYCQFFIETINIQNSAHMNQIKNENSDWSITLTLEWDSFFMQN